MITFTRCSVCGKESFPSLTEKCEKQHTCKHTELKYELITDCVQVGGCGCIEDIEIPSGIMRRCSMCEKEFGEIYLNDEKVLEKLYKLFK